MGQTKIRLGCVKVSGIMGNKTADEMAKVWSAEESGSRVTEGESKSRLGRSGRIIALETVQRDRCPATIYVRLQTNKDNLHSWRRHRRGI